MSEDERLLENDVIIFRQWTHVENENENESEDIINKKKKSSSCKYMRIIELKRCQMPLFVKLRYNIYFSNPKRLRKTNTSQGERQLSLGWSTRSIWMLN